jgi:NAD(P)-dependent dehydrogenase (short-subunit alcohol dehydrogenase family)
MKNILIFGASGSIGNHIYNSFKLLDTNNIIYGTTSKQSIIIESNNNESNNYLYVNNDNLDSLKNINNLDIIVWAHGYNFNDNIFNFNEEEYMKIMNANILFIIKTLNYLLNNNKINDNAKMVIISSIWEDYTRDNKLSYSISKSALSGLVKNVAYDLSKKNILINNVLPGVIDNEMSRKTLKEEQINYIKNYLFFDRLVNLDDVFNTVKFLTIENTGITGESIKVDLGFTKIKKYN